MSPTRAEHKLWSAIEQAHLYDWAKPGCLFLFLEEANATFIEFSVHERHGGRCPWDAKSAPIGDGYRVQRVSQQMDGLDVNTGQYVSFEEFVRYRGRGPNPTLKQ